MPSLLDFLNLEEIQYHRCLTTEKGNQHSNFIAIHINIADRAYKFSERAINDTHALAFSEANLSLWLIRLFGYLLQNRLDLVFLQRNWAIARTNKARDTGCIPYNIPRFIAHNHLHQHITGEDFTLHCTPLTLFNLHLFFHGDNHTEDFVAHIH